MAPVRVEREVRGRWISGPSAERNVGLLRRRELAELRRLGTVRRVEAGTVVAASGSRVTQVHVVGDGELELRARLDEGRATMAVVRTGGVIADIPLLLGAPMPFDAIASRDTELIALSRQRWIQLLTGSPDLALRWMTSIARRLDDDRRRLVTLAREQAANVGHVQDGTWQAALDAGWTDEELTETTAVVALSLFTNYVNHTVQTDLDLPPAPEL